MRLRFSFLLMLLAVIFVQVIATQISYSLNLLGEASTSVRMPGVFANRTVQCRLSPDSYSGVSVSRDVSDVENSQAIIFQNTIDGGPLDHRTDKFRANENPIAEMIDYPFCAIGSGSPLLREYHSVDVIRWDNNRSGIIRLGETRDSFSTGFCDNRTLIQVPFSGTAGFIPGVEFDAEVSVVNISTPISEGLMVLRGIPHHPLVVPSPIYEYLLSIIGAERGLFIHFGNCTALMSQLPRIKITFSARSGDLILFPEDYVKPLIGFDTCHLAITEQSYGPLAFNPFLISGLNVRFEEDNVFFCDPRIL